MTRRGSKSLSCSSSRASARTCSVVSPDLIEYCFIPGSSLTCRDLATTSTPHANRGTRVGDSSTRGRCGCRRHRAVIHTEAMVSALNGNSCCDGQSREPPQFRNCWLCFAGWKGREGGKRGATPRAAPAGAGRTLGKLQDPRFGPGTHCPVGLGNLQRFRGHELPGGTQTVPEGGVWLAGLLVLAHRNRESAD